MIDAIHPYAKGCRPGASHCHAWLMSTFLSVDLQYHPRSIKNEQIWRLHGKHMGEAELIISPRVQRCEASAKIIP